LDISVIVPVHNGGGAFDRCLAGLAAADPGPHEIIVVPDGESDGAWRRADDSGARVLEPSDAPHGPAHARNRGARHASGEILFFVDADVVVHPGALGEVVAAFDDPSLDAVIGSYDDAPGDPSFLSQYRNLLHHYVHQRSSEEASTFWGACGAIRREAFFAVGGFDESYGRPSIEDIELGYRLKAAGRRIVLRKTLLVKHLKTWDAAGILRTDFFSRALPWTELLLRRGRAENDLNVTAGARASVAAACTLALTPVLAIAHPAAVVLGAVAAALLLALNAPLYRFFLARRGPLFALAAIPWHWLYFLYSGVAFAVGLVRHAYRTLRAAPAAGVAVR
jgi:GT2 family glycosyltransferase